MASSVLEDQDYVNKIKQQAASIFDPQRDLALNKLDQANAGLDINQTDIGRQYDTLGQTLKENAARSNQYLQERNNQLGLLQSGRTAAGMGDIQTKLNTNLANAEQDKASRLAQLALQRAGLTTQRAQVQSQYTNDLNGYVQKLLDQEQQRRNDEEKYQQQLLLEQQKAARSRASSGYNDQLNQMLMAAMTGQQLPQNQPQQPSYDPNEDLDSLLGNYSQPAGPTNPSTQPQQPTFWQDFSKPRSIPQQIQYVQQVQTPSWMGNIGQKIFGKNLFWRG